MTERSRGAPDPTEPPCRTESPCHIESSCRTGSPCLDDAPVGSADLSTLYRTDALIEALAARVLPGSSLPLVSDPPPASDASRRPRPVAGPDPVPGLLAALIADVDEGLPALSAARPRLHRTFETATRHGADAVSTEVVSAGAVTAGESVPGSNSGSDGSSRRNGDGDVPEQQGSGPSRRGPRTIVALGVVGAVLATTGVAAAGGGLAGSPTASSAARIAGRPAPSGQVKAGGDGTSSAKPQPPAGRRAPRAHEEKHRAGRSGASDKGTAKKRGPSDEERLRNRLDELLKDRPPRHPPTRSDAADRLRRRLEEIRRRVEQRIGRSRP
ncbi:hypothetical protein [Actinomadura harenae]|uniref:Uncharacterized protein n=1 Tax=Actinomadura harenae TaxID=2483351 RepID=A0A3M2M6K0_9ACTN|nr:hypothetical protein [Actinomadura harenae]RMI45079.1 hypothetical protein EBO15_10950 [Actinomadura harenae]